MTKEVKLLRMEFSIVENLSGPQESIFNLSRGTRLHFGEKTKKYEVLLNLPIFPLSPCLGSLGLLSLEVIYQGHGQAMVRPGPGPWPNALAIERRP